MTIRQIAAFGDSLFAGNYPTGISSTALGGRGSFLELAAERLANIRGLGPLLGPGYQHAGLSQWSYTGSWSNPQTTDVFDKFPYGSVASAYSAAGATAIAKWTKPTAWRPIVGFAFYICDYASSGNVRYRIDGGSWINIGQTLNHTDNKVLEFYVNTPITTTFEVQAYDGSSSAGVCFGGIEPFYVDPTTAGVDGLIVQNYGVDGQTLRNCVIATSGDRLAIVDSKKYGTGGLPVRTVLATLMMHANDVGLVNNATTWDTDCGTFYTRMSPLGSVAFLSPWETVYSAANQATYRSHTVTKAAAVGAQLLDLFERYKQLGYGGQGTQNGNIQGFGLVVDATHPTQAGHFDLTHPIYWFLRNNYFTAYNGFPSSYPVAGKLAAVAYVGRRAAVAYGAGQPISMVPQ